jgi:hypothetical protein
VLPRCVHLLPAARHLLIAVSMLDQRYHGINPPEMMVRARRIMDHYNSALAVLTSKDVEPLDLYLSPLLAWIIEIMVNNPQTAIMHIKHSRKMLEGLEPKPHDSNDTQDIVQDFVKDTQRFCSGFTSTSAACAGILSSDPCSIFQTLNVRQQISPDTPTEEVRQAIYKYATSLDSDGQTKFPFKEALEYLRHWESHTLVTRYIYREARDTIVATHFLIATATTLLTAPNECSQDTFTRQKEAWEYLLVKLEDCLDVEALDEKNRQGLEDAVAFALSLIARFAKGEIFKAKAIELMGRTSPSNRTGLYWMSWMKRSPASRNGNGSVEDSSASSSSGSERGTYRTRETSVVSEIPTPAWASRDNGSPALAIR